MQYLLVVSISKHDKIVIALQNCPTCRLKNILQLKPYKIIAHTVVLTGESEQSDVVLL